MKKIKNKYFEEERINRIINKKARKYFIQQKIAEICIGLVGIFLLILIPYLIGLWNPFSIQKETMCGEEGLCAYNFAYVEALGWVNFVFIIIGGLSAFLILFGGYKILSQWINTNWDKAVRRAFKEVRGK